MTKAKSKTKIHVEPKGPAVPYGQMPQGARDALCDALLILAQRGREVLAGQVSEQINRAQGAREASSRP
jgi:ABC-type uncharacterized transport system ATPase subunit